MSRRDSQRVCAIRSVASAVKGGGRTRAPTSACLPRSDRFFAPSRNAFDDRRVRRLRFFECRERPPGAPADPDGELGGDAGLLAAGLRGRTGRAPRQGQRDRGARVRESGGAAGAPGVVAARDRGQAPPRHHRRDADGAFRGRGGASAPVRRSAAVRAAAGSDPQGAGGLRGDGGHERLFGAVASDRRAGARGGLRRSGARPPRRGGRGGSRRARRPACSDRRAGASGRGQRRAAPGGGAVRRRSGREGTRAAASARRVRGRGRRQVPRWSTTRPWPRI